MLPAARLEEGAEGEEEEAGADIDRPSRIGASSGLVGEVEDVSERGRPTSS